jgi:hypothetical protein
MQAVEHMVCNNQQRCQGLEDEIAQLQSAQAALAEGARTHEQRHASDRQELLSTMQKVGELEEHCRAANERADAAAQAAEELQQRCDELQRQQEVGLHCTRISSHARGYLAPYSVLA